MALDKLTAQKYRSLSVLNCSLQLASGKHNKHGRQFEFQRQHDSLVTI